MDTEVRLHFLFKILSNKLFYVHKLNLISRYIFFISEFSSILKSFHYVLFHFLEQIYWSSLVKISSAVAILGLDPTFPNHFLRSENWQSMQQLCWLVCRKLCSTWRTTYRWRIHHRLLGLHYWKQQNYIYMLLTIYSNIGATDNCFADPPPEALCRLWKGTRHLQSMNSNIFILIELQTF